MSGRSIRSIPSVCDAARLAARFSSTTRAKALANIT